MGKKIDENLHLYNQGKGGKIIECWIITWVKGANMLSLRFLSPPPPSKA